MRTVLLLSLVALLSTSCQAISLPTGTSELPSGSVLFQDDFSDPGSGWERLAGSQDGALDYTAGVYRILVSGEQTMLWSGPGLEFDDVRIEVEAVHLSGPEDDNFGLVCRSQDRANFYFLAISSDGYYGIGKVKDGVPELIGERAMPPSEAIQRGNAKNHLRADCAGQELGLHVNGQLVAIVEDAEFASGGVGLMAGTFGEPGTEVAFDNFTVLKP